MHNFYSSPGDDLFSGRIDDNLELLKAWAGTSLAFAVAFSGGDIFRFAFFTNLLIAAVTGGIAFVVHELAHRIVARSYGAQAHFKSNDGMLVLSVLVAFTGWFIAAPGAVWHRGGYLTPQRSGLIALAGPASNFVLAALALVPLYAVVTGMLPATDFWFRVLWVGYNINAWIGLFNMIPVAPFDGEKIWRWNKMVFGVTVAVGVIMVFLLPGFIGL